MELDLFRDGEFPVDPDQSRIGLALTVAFVGPRHPGFRHRRRTRLLPRLSLLFSGSSNLDTDSQFRSATDPEIDSRRATTKRRSHRLSIAGCRLYVFALSDRSVLGHFSGCSHGLRRSEEEEEFVR